MLEGGFNGSETRVLEARFSRRSLKIWSRFLLFPELVTVAELALTVSARVSLTAAE